MANRDSEIDLRIRAQVADAQRALRDTQGAIERIGRAAAEASAEVGAIGSGGAGSSPAAGAAQQEAAATSALNSTLNDSAAARDAVARAARATQQAVAAEIGMIGELQGRLERGASSFDDLADTEARLDVAMAKGLITSEEYDAALAKLNDEQARLTREGERSSKSLETTVGRYDKAGAALQRLARDEAKLKEAVDAGRISREQYNRALATIGTERTRLIALREGASNAAGAMRRLSFESLGVQRNLTQLVTYSVTGQWQLAGNQILQLGNQAGLASRLFSTAGLAIGGTAVVVGGLTAALVQNYLQWRALDTAVIATGNSLGLTTGQVADVRNQVGEATDNFGDAQDAMLGLVQSGKLSGESLKSAATAAVNLSELTGRSIQETTSEIINLAKSPTAGLLELNDRYHFLTLEVYDNVRSLEEQGRTQDAVRVITEQLAQVTSQRVAEMRANAGTLERAWRDVLGVLGRVMQELRDIGRTDVEARIAVAQRAIRIQRDQIAGAQEDYRLGIRSRSEAERAIAIAQRKIEVEQQTLGVLGEQKKVADAKAKAEAEAQAQRDRGVAAAASIDRQLAGADRQIAKQQELNALVKQFNDLRQLNPDDPRLADVLFTTNGPQGGAFDKLKAAIDAKYAVRQRKAKEKDPDESAQRELDNLQKQLALLDSLAEGEDRVSEAARVRYEMEQGAYQGASEALKQQILDNAQLLDSERAKREEAKKHKQEIEETTRAYEQLRDSLQTPVEAALDDAIDKVNVLNKALKDGVADKAAYDEALGRIVAGAFDKAPKFAGLAPEIGGPFGELGKINEARDELQKWYAEQLALLNDFRAKKLGTVEQWNQQEQLIEAQHNAALMQLNSAQTQVMLAGASAAFGQLADIAKAYGGEQSKTYRALFALSKGFAVAQAAVALAQNVAEASKYGFPQNLVFIAGAFAQGAQIASLLASANFNGGGGGGFATGGHVRGPGTGTSDSITAQLSDYEFITRAAVVRQPGALAFLEDFNERGMAALGQWTRFAEGGLAVPESPRLPSPDWAQLGAQSQASVQNRMRVYLFQDRDALAQELAKHPALEKAVIAIVGENGQAVTANW